MKTGRDQDLYKIAGRTGWRNEVILTSSHLIDHASTPQITLKKHLTNVKKHI